MCVKVLTVENSSISSIKDVCMCVCVCAHMDRERASVCVRERESECVCVCEREMGSVVMQGDYGVPRVCRQAGEVERRFLQVGILSYGWGSCGRKGAATLYTRVYSHLQFI